jgi:flavin-dependent dehydrogenase
MNSVPDYDVIIIGGGLSGLALAIQLRKIPCSVLVIEKEVYPRHKVCGEYISMESKPFLESLGLPLDSMALPRIDQLKVTDVKGTVLHAALLPGGFGVSRYKLDAALAELAIAAGVQLLSKTKADQVTFDKEVFTVQAQQQHFTARVVCGAWGKRSNIDIRWQRNFIQAQKKSLNNYVGIKYHIQYPWPDGVIALHNFQDGYCGISNIEEGKTCLCYLTRASNLQQWGNDIKQMEQQVLMQNPHLKQIFTGAQFLWSSPLAISQISFQKKEQVADHVLLLGDAAGLITPLCGNGMSMAFHASKLAYQVIHDFMLQRISRETMEKRYESTWKSTFATRLTAGRILQANFGKQQLTSFFLRTLKALPFLQKPLIRATFGRTF